MTDQTKSKSRIKHVALSVASVLALTTGLAAAPAMAQVQQARDITLEPMPIADAVNAIADQSGTQIVLYSNDVNGLTAPALDGSYTTEQALDTILKGTDLQYRRVNDRTIAVGPASRFAEADPSNTIPTNGAPTDEETSPESFRLAQLDQAETIRSIETAEDQDELDERREDVVIVTGTNIRGLSNQPSPVTVIDRDTIDAAGFVTTQELLRNLPQNVNSEGGALGNANNEVIPGGASVNLRGLGTASTLILVNGRRVAPGGNAERVDVSLIPLSAVERVEVLTDGASAIYGSDAIAGVVNFILKDEFDGAETRLRFGTVTEGSSQEYQASQTLGRAWSGGNLLANYEYYRRNNLDANDRSFSEDTPDPTNLFPGTERHNVFVTGRQSVSEAVEFFADAVFSQSETENTTSNISGTTVSTTVTQSTSQQHGGTLGFDASLGSDWRAHAFTSFNRSDLDASVLQNGATVTDSTIEASIWTGEARADGPIFSLPGGDVQLVVGAQYRSENFDSDVTFFGTPTLVQSDRDIFAAYSEVFVPLVGSDNRRDWLHSLDFTLAGRFEEYSDFGSTFDPKIGVRLAPTESLSLRSTFGTSFRAPEFQQLNGDVVFAALPGFFFVPPPGQTSSPNVIQIGGANPNLGPEESESWSLGFDYDAPIADDLTINATYFAISYEDRIAQPLNGSLFSILTDPAILDGSLLNTSPAQSEVDAIFALSNFFNFFNVPADGIGAIADTTLQNTSITDQRGLDFSVSYGRDIQFAQLSLGLSGTYVLEFENQATPTSDAIDVVDTLNNPVDLRLRGNIGLATDTVSGTLFINYVDDYVSNATGTEQNVGSWTTLDLNVRWSLGKSFESSIFDQTELALTVQNLTNEDPPFVDRFAGATQAFFDGNNASPLGRFVAVQLKKEF